MSEDWDFYSCRVDGKPASIFVDLGIAGDVPLAGFDHLGTIRVKLRKPRPDGLSSTEEYENLVRMEDAIVSAVCIAGDAVYVGRSTSDGWRDFSFYVKDGPAFEETAQMALNREPNLQWEVESEEDPDWQQYRQFLHPPADELQRIIDRRSRQEPQAGEP